MKKIFGNYGLVVSLFCVSIFIFLLYFNFLFWKSYFHGDFPNEKTMFIFVFIDLFLALLISSPYLSEKAKKISNGKISIFLDIPKKGTPITFPMLVDFLGAQSVAGFLATVLIFTGKELLGAYGGAVAALYMFILFVLIMFMASLSLMRLMSFLSQYGAKVFIFACVPSTVIMFSFINIGLRLAP